MRMRRSVARVARAPIAFDVRPFECSLTQREQSPLERATSPAFTGPRGPRAPAVVPQGAFTLLFLEQRAGTKEDWPAIAAGIAPATRRIPVD